MPSPAKPGRKSTPERATPPRKHTETAPRGPDAGSPQAADRHLHVHTVHSYLPIPYFTPSDVAHNTRAVASWLPPMPPARDAVFYGGLGALAVAGALQWPVAVAIGGATMVLRHRGNDTPQAQTPPESQKQGRTKARQEMSPAEGSGSRARTS